MRFSLVFLLPLAMAAICPMENHQVCNAGHEDHKCVCQISQMDETSAPEQSCNNLIQYDAQNNTFPVVSIDFNLDASVDGLDEFPEESFKDAIANSLRIDEDDILILRVGCQGSETKLTIQFAVLKKGSSPAPHSNHNETSTEDDGSEEDNKKDVDDNDDDEDSSDLPYAEEDFANAESIAERLKGFGNLDQIADLDVDVIEFTEDLIDVEFEPDNTTLIVQGILTAAGFGFMFGLGIWFACRRNDYSDDLQKA